jgi:hypothetical protein
MDVAACLVRPAQHAGHVVRTSDSFHCGTSGGHAVVGRNFNKSFRKGPSSSLVVLPQANFCSKDVRGIYNYGLLNRQQLSDGQIVEVTERRKFRVNCVQNCSLDLQNRSSCCLHDTKNVICRRGISFPWEQHKLELPLPVL